MCFHSSPNGFRTYFIQTALHASTPKYSNRMSERTRKKCKLWARPRHAICFLLFTQQKCKTYATILHYTQSICHFSHGTVKAIWSACRKRVPLRYGSTRFDRWKRGGGIIEFILIIKSHTVSTRVVTFLPPTTGNMLGGIIFPPCMSYGVYFGRTTFSIYIFLNQCFVHNTHTQYKCV